MVCMRAHWYVSIELLVHVILKDFCCYRPNRERERICVCVCVAWSIAVYQYSVLISIQCISVSCCVDNAHFSGSMHWLARKGSSLVLPDTIIA